MKARWVFLFVAAAVATALGGEFFLTVREQDSTGEVLKLNGVVSGEGWGVHGDTSMPAAARAVSQGPLDDPAAFLESDRELGYRLRVGLRALPGRLRVGGTPVYDVSYSTDAHGWRRSVDVPGARGDVLFFGGGATFGLGLNDEQTLPSRFAAEMHGVARSHNFGVPGWSAPQVARLLEAGRERDALVHGTPTKAFFLLTGSELYRSRQFDGSVCTLSALCDWLRGRHGDERIPSEELAISLASAAQVLTGRYKIHLTVVSWNPGDAELDALEKSLATRGLDVVRAREVMPKPSFSPMADDLAKLAHYLAERLKG